MRATSLASADRDSVPEEAFPPVAPRLAREFVQSPLHLWWEAASVAWGRLVLALLLWFRGGWLYRQTLRGPIPDRIQFYPDDPRMRRLEDADAFMRGRFRLASEKLDIKEGCVFDQAPPSAGFSAALHGFDWVRHLEVAGGDLSRQFALKLTQQWLKRYSRFHPLAWRPEIMAERLINLFAHGRFFIVNSDLVWRSKLFVSLRNQAQMLARTMQEAPEGLPRLKSAAAVALAGLCLGDSRNTAIGLKQLALEIAQQVLPDGGHVSRSPDTLLEVFGVLAMVQQALDHANRGVQPAVRNALDRIAPMLRFFRAGDGGLFVFHGGGESDTRTVEAALDHDEALGKPLGHAPYCGYQRLAAGRTLVLLDAGAPPSGSASTTAHAGCLAFEMASGLYRIIVNCGMAPGDNEAWTLALRSTAAHSTLMLDEVSSASVLHTPSLVRLLGFRLATAPHLVETRRSESAQGLTVDANHDGYLLRFGVIHQRRLTLSPRGMTLTGSDRLIPANANGRHVRLRAARVPYTIRFHVHPDVRLSLAQNGGSVILKLPNGEGWRFRCSGGVLAIEESIYFGGGSARRAEQLVISAEWQGEATECAWLFEQMGPT
jgi:uncharacterized heparinase superfamily protein